MQQKALRSAEYGSRMGTEGGNLECSTRRRGMFRTVAIPLAEQLQNWQYSLWPAGILRFHPLERPQQYAKAASSVYQLSSRLVWSIEEHKAHLPGLGGTPGGIAHPCRSFREGFHGHPTRRASLEQGSEAQGGVWQCLSSTATLYLEAGARER